MSRWSDQVRDEYSRPVPGVSIYVYKWDALAQVAGDLETLTDDSAAPLANPVISDDDGIYYFNSLDGQKLLELHYGGKVQERELILVGALPVPQATFGGLFINAAALTIPVGMDLISTTGYSSIGKGAADYVSDAAVNSAYVIAHPLTSFISVNGRGFRLSLEQDITPQMFGVLANGSNETISIQAALNCGAARIIYPPGSYGATALVVPSAVQIEGSGEDTFFVPLDNSSAYMTLAGGNLISNFQVVPGSQRTGGTIFKPTGNEVTIRNFKVSNCFKIADISGTVGQFTIDQFNFRDNNNNGASELILVDTSGSGNTITNGISDNNPATQPSAGIRIRSCPDLLLDDLDLITCGAPLKIDPLTGKVVASVQGGSLYLDSSSVNGLVLDSSGGGSIVRCQFGFIEASSHTSHGVSMNASAGQIGGITISHLETNVGSADGLHMTGANFGNVTILHHSAAGNTVGAAVSLGASTPGPTILEAQYGNIDGIGSANKYGLNLGTGSTIKIRGGLITGNTTADVTGDTSGATILGVTGVVTRNRGSATLASGGTSIVVSHGLAGTPSANNIKFWPTSNQASTPLWLDTTTITSTQFTVKTTSAAAANITFGWEASCLGA